MDFFQQADSFLGTLCSRVLAVVLVLLGLLGFFLGIKIVFGEAASASGFVPFAFGLIFCALGVYVWRRPSRLSDLLSSL